MRINKFLSFFIGCGLFVLFAARGVDMPLGYAIGDKIKDFKLKNIDGQMVSLSGYLDAQKAQGVVVVFTCNTCPYAVASEDRIIAFHKKYAEKGYPVIAINPNVPNNDYPKESFKNMQTRAKRKKFPFPYLADADQSIARTFGASRTPHVFIASRSRDGQVLTLRYKGAFDDDPMNAASVKERFVETAVSTLLKKQKLTTTTAKAIGCGIKWTK